MMKKMMKKMMETMMGKAAACMAAVVMAAGMLTGCGSAQPQDNAGKEGDGSLKAAYISSCPFEDGGWGSSCYAGFQASAEKFKDIKTFEVENVALENMTSTVKQYCEAGADLIISPDVDLSDSISEVAKDYPKVHFAVIDGTYTADNAMAMSQDNAQIGFIAGVIAALQTTTNSVGFVGGEESEEILKASRTMEAGAKYINPDIQFTSAMSGSWTDVAKGKEIGLSLISSNKADVIFSFASGVDAGVREACQSAKGVYFIAQPDEAMEKAPEITITSIIQSNEQLIYNAMDAVAQGTFEGNFKKYGFEEGGTCSLGKFNACFDQEKQDKVNEVMKKILSGEIDVYSYCE